jgi:hypothetical protein
MFRARTLLLLLASALTVAGCGAVHRPLAGTIKPGTTHEGRARIDDPRTKHIMCLRQHGFSVRRVGLTGIQIGVSGEGPYVQFQPTPGAAQALQMEGITENAEVIGSALLYPRNASDAHLKKIENCIAAGVAG